MCIKLKLILIILFFLNGVLYSQDLNNKSVYKLNRFDSTVFKYFYYFEFIDSTGKMIQVISYKNSNEINKECSITLKKSKKYFFSINEIGSVLVGDSFKYYMDFQKVGIIGNDGITKIGGHDREPVYMSNNIILDKIECDARKKRKVFKFFQK